MQYDFETITIQLKSPILHGIVYEIVYTTWCIALQFPMMYMFKYPSFHRHKSSATPPNSSSSWYSIYKLVYWVEFPFPMPPPNENTSPIWPLPRTWRWWISLVRGRSESIYLDVVVVVDYDDYYSDFDVAAPFPNSHEPPHKTRRPSPTAPARTALHPTWADIDISRCLHGNILGIRPWDR